MRKTREQERIRARRRVTQIALIAGAAGLCFATSASAESQAAKKMGQIGVINQTLQPKPLKSSNANSNTANTNTTNPNYNANSTYNANAANAANAGTAANGTKK